MVINQVIEFMRNFESILIGISFAVVTVGVLAVIAWKGVK